MIINEKGTYTDKSTRNILIPFSTNLAVGATVREFKISDDLYKVLGDERELSKIRMMLANNEDVGAEYSGLKESVNFSHLKSLANTLIPHNITAKINLEIAKRVKGYGNINGKQIVLYILLILGAVALMALVLYLVMGGKGGGGAGTTIINNGAQTVANATSAIIAG
jgi:ABC-type maltose transport system permease subunit